jgi:hypothetical protein
MAEQENKTHGNYQRMQNKSIKKGKTSKYG